MSPLVMPEEVEAVVIEQKGAVTGQGEGLLVDLVDLVVAVAAGGASTTWVDGEPVVVVVVIVSAREAPGLSTSATSPTRRTVAAIAPRRAALIGRTAAERV
jgi:hypothetical protein